MPHPAPLHVTLQFAALLVIGLSLGVAVNAMPVLPLRFSVLVEDCDYVVHTTVRRVAAEKRPVGQGTRIVTVVEFEVLNVVAGTPPEPLVLELPGGRVGDEDVEVEGIPHFAVGDEDILFVSDHERDLCPITGMGYGRYPVRIDPANGRKYVVRSGGQPLRTTSQVATPLADDPTDPRPGAAADALSVEEFTDNIRAAASWKVANARR